MHEPPEDYFVIHCKGHLCGQTHTITMSELRRSLKGIPYNSFKHYADNYFCDSCTFSVVNLVETISEC